MKPEEKNLDKAQKLMLLQGIGLIHDGIQFIEWAEKMPNELSYDFFMVLKDRFDMFRECVLDGSADHLLIDRVKDGLEDVKHNYELNRQLQEQLKKLREIVMIEQYQKKTEKQ